MSQPRRFHLQRNTDITGVSGTGRVADGVLWSDGTVSVRWLGERPCTVFWGDLAHAEHVHGHGGHAVIVWDDPEPAPTDTPPPTAAPSPGTSASPPTSTATVSRSACTSSGPRARTSPSRTPRGSAPDSRVRQRVDREVAVTYVLVALLAGAVGWQLGHATARVRHILIGTTAEQDQAALEAAGAAEHRSHPDSETAA